MAIFGAGSVWKKEEKDNFFQNEHYIIGWDYGAADDLYEAVFTTKSWRYYIFKK